MVTGERALAAPPGRQARTGRLIAFFALAYILSWSWVVPLAAAHQVVQRGSGWPTHYPALFGPAIAAIAVTAWTAGRPGVRDLLLRMGRWRVGLGWWLAALSPVLFLGLGLIAEALAGKPLPREAAFGSFSGIPQLGLVAVVLLIILGALGEEAGWRGYALPQLQHRFSPLASTLLLAVHQRPNKPVLTPAISGHDIPSAICSPGHRQGHDLEVGLSQEARAEPVLTCLRLPERESAGDRPASPLLGLARPRPNGR